MLMALCIKTGGRRRSMPSSGSAELDVPLFARRGELAPSVRFAHFRSATRTYKHDIRHVYKQVLPSIP
jgi:hypothetical protein